jgi:hypothetical protein
MISVDNVFTSFHILGQLEVDFLLIYLVAVYTVLVALFVKANDDSLFS